MDNKKTAILFEVREFCLHDGPGVRTTVFFKGCPLRCTWCHNPEGLSKEVRGPVGAGERAGPARQQMLNDYQDVWQRLGKEKAPVNAARIMISTLRS